MLPTAMRLALSRPAAVVAVVLLLGVAALASREPLKGLGRGGSGAAARLAPVHVSEPQPPGLAFVLISVGAAIALMAAIVHLRRQRARDNRKPRPFTAGWTVRFVVLLVPVLVGLLLIATGTVGLHRRPLVHGAGAGAGRAARALPRTYSYDFSTWGLAAILVVLVAGGAVLLVARPRLRRADRVVQVVGEDLAPALIAAVDVSLADLEAERDPRRAVIAAYHRMEMTLSRAGLPRRAAEAPREYLTRAVGTLELSQAPLQALTGLFEQARFSLRQIDSGLRDQAIAALTEVRRELTVA
jgi:hypothetical protein